MFCFCDAKFSYEEKQMCVPIAKRMIKLAHLVKNAGIMALEDEDVYDVPLLKMGINLILDDVHSNDLERILKNFVLSSHHIGFFLLEKLVIFEGILAVRKRYTASAVSNIMAYILGVEYLEEFLNSYRDNIDCDYFIQLYTKPMQESLYFEDKLLSADKNKLSDLLLSLDYSLLAAAFYGCSEAFNKNIQKYMPKSKFIDICELFSQILYSSVTILEHQQVILKQL